jgi:predicted dinucleotide-binding enzyme
MGMRVGVVGAGRIGGNAGRQLARSGHEVVFSFSRDAGKLARLAASAPGARAGTPADAVAFAEVVIFAVPWTAIDDALGVMGPLDGKVVVDATNQFGRGGVDPLPGGLSAVEFNGRRMPGAALAKAFNTLTAGYQLSVANGEQGEVAMFFAAEDSAAVDATRIVVEGCGFVPVHLGGWDRVALMEAPRRPGSVYGEAYRPDDARRIAAAPLGEAARLAGELKIPA